MRNRSKSNLCVLLFALLCLSACAGLGTSSNTPAQPDSRLRQEGLRLFAQGEYELAFEAFQEAARGDKENAHLSYNMGLCLSRLGRPAEAIEHYTRALSLDPALVQPLVSRAEAHTRLKQYNQALDDLSRVLEQSPDDPTILYNRGNIYLQMGKCEQAIDSYTRCLEQDQSMARAYNNRGICFLKKARYGRARDDFSRAHALRSRNPNYLFNRGLANEGDYAFDQAISDYSLALDENPDHAPALYNRGLLFYNLGNKQRGCRDLARACDLGLCTRFHELRESGECQGCETN